MHIAYILLYVCTAIAPLQLQLYIQLHWLHDCDVIHGIDCDGCAISNTYIGIHTYINMNTYIVIHPWKPSRYSTWTCGHYSVCSWHTYATECSYIHTYRVTYMPMSGGLHTHTWTCHHIPDTSQYLSPVREYIHHIQYITYSSITMTFRPWWPHIIHIIHSLYFSTYKVTLHTLRYYIYIVLTFIDPIHGTYIHTYHYSSIVIHTGYIGYRSLDRSRDVHMPGHEWNIRYIHYNYFDITSTHTYMVGYNNIIIHSSTTYQIQ